MTNDERARKIQQAKDLIREVEFSYPQGDLTRKSLYKVVVEVFGPFSYLSNFITANRD